MAILSGFNFEGELLTLLLCYDKNTSLPIDSGQKIGIYYSDDITYSKPLYELTTNGIINHTKISLPLNYSYNIHHLTTVPEIIKPDDIIFTYNNKSMIMPTFPVLDYHIFEYSSDTTVTFPLFYSNFYTKMDICAIGAGGNGGSALGGGGGGGYVENRCNLTLTDFLNQEFTINIALNNSSSTSINSESFTLTAQSGESGGWGDMYTPKTGKGGNGGSGGGTGDGGNGGSNGSNGFGSNPGIGQGTSTHLFLDETLPCYGAGGGGGNNWGGVVGTGGVLGGGNGVSSDEGYGGPGTAYGAGGGGGYQNNRGGTGYQGAVFIRLKK